MAAVAALAVLCSCLMPSGAVHAQATVENSVVKVFATLRYPDPFKTWTKEAPSDVTAAGVVIEGKRILTNAHVVLYASQVQVQANEAGDKVAATVVAVAPGIERDEDFRVGGPDGAVVAVRSIDAAVGQADVVDDAHEFARRNLAADALVDQIGEARCFLDAGAGSGAEMQVDLPVVAARKEVLAELREEKKAREARAEE